MRPNEYQNLAKGTALPGAWNLAYLIPGLAGETAELFEKLADGADRDLVLHEAADHLWFIAMICEVMDWSMEVIIGDSPSIIQQMCNGWAKLRTQDEITSRLVIQTGNANTAWAKAVRDNGGNLDEKRVRQILTAVMETYSIVGEFAAQYGVTIEELMEMNIDKLYDRKDRGVLGGDGDKR